MPRRQTATTEEFLAVGTPVISTQPGPGRVHPNALRWVDRGRGLHTAQVPGGGPRDQVHAHNQVDGTYFVHQVQDASGGDPGFRRSLSVDAHNAAQN